MSNCVYILYTYIYNNNTNHVYKHSSNTTKINFYARMEFY